jgi:murein DD-endopeptidase MepM/ murein hydrolase activator NlpD
VAVDAEGMIFVSNFGPDVWSVTPGGKVTQLADDFQQASGNAIGPDGNNASGAGSILEHFHSYGDALYAVADGEVVTAVDYLEDNPAGVDPGPLTWDEMPGNHVILKIAPHTYAVYVHLRKGTLRVEPGERVKRGDVIAAIGNSGNVSAPHLHFHISDRPHVNNAQGVPFVFRAFELVLEDYGFRPDQRPLPDEGRTIERSIPGAGWVIRFPSE